MEPSDLMMLAHVRPGDLFWMTDVFQGFGWFTCVAISHYHNGDGVSYSRVTIIAPEKMKLHTFSQRSAREVVMIEGRAWT